MQRREFLKTLGFVSAGATLSQLGMLRAHAQASDDYKALVCVFLYGGNDGNNTIVPIDGRYDAYANLRGSLALSAQTLIPLPDVSGNVAYGLHPALAPLKNAWMNGHLSVLLNTGPMLRPVTRAELREGQGRPAGLFSHADQQQAWQIAAGSKESYGWGGRIADELRALNHGAKSSTVTAIARDAAFTNRRTGGALVLPASGGLNLRGSDSSTTAKARNAALERMLVMDKNFELIAAAQDVTGDALARRAAINSIVNASSTRVTNAFRGQSSALARQLDTVAKLIERQSDLGLRRQVFFVGFGGFDTHSGQLATQSGLLSQLGAALKSFYDATVAMGIEDKVTTFTLSDFARTMRTNTVGGTDHAWGNHHLIVGGAVSGRTLYGELPQHIAGGPDDAGDDGRWIPTTSVDQYAATLARWFGVGEARLTSVFPSLKNFSTGALSFMG